MTTTTLTARPSRRGRFGRFLLHFFEMCAPMRVGCAIGDLIYFLGREQVRLLRALQRAARAVGGHRDVHDDGADGRLDGLPRHAASTDYGDGGRHARARGGAARFGWLSLLPMGDLALLEHGLMMPAMLVPMLFRLDLYTTRHSHHGVARAEHRVRGAHGH
jgi:hypothetical protein